MLHLKNYFKLGIKIIQIMCLLKKNHTIPVKYMESIRSAQFTAYHQLFSHLN